MKHPCDEILDAYAERAVPSAQLRFNHHWLKVTTEEAREKWLRVLRVGDCEEGSAPGFFLQENGPSFVYPLSLFGYYLGFALRALESKTMRTFVRYPKSACYTAFAGSSQQMPGSGVTVILVEGFADAEAVSRFHPWVIATMGGKLRTALYPVIASVTRKVLLLTDNDKAGEEGSKAEEHGFQVLGRQAERVAYPKKYKDPAEWWLAEGDRMGDILRRVI